MFFAIVTLISVGGLDALYIGFHGISQSAHGYLFHDHNISRNGIDDGNISVNCGLINSVEIAVGPKSALTSHVSAHRHVGDNAQIAATRPAVHDVVGFGLSAFASPCTG